MKEALARVAHVLKTSNLAPHLSYVRVTDGWMSASDGRIYVSAPVDCGLDFCVQGSELQRALDFDDMEMRLTDKGLLFKKGRSRITLKTLSGEEFYEVEQPDGWRPVPEGYVDALFRARQFTSENATQAWALGVMNIDGRLVATNNIVLACVDFPNAPIKGVVPSWLIDFLAKMGERPIGCWDTSNEIYLKFADDSWLRSLRIEGEPPAQMQPFVADLYARDTSDTWEIPAEWRSTYRRTLEFSKRDIHVTPTCIRASSDTAEVTTDIETPVPHPTLWDHKFLGPVLHEADYWDITNCGTQETPKHTFWHGDGIRGLVCSKRLAGV